MSDWNQINQRKWPGQYESTSPSTSAHYVEANIGPALRDRFAMAAMRGLLSTQYPTSLSFIAQEAYRLADEMLKARDV